MKIVENFKEILDNYLKSIKEGKFNKNHPMFQLINYKTVDSINEIVSKYNLCVKALCRAGGWTSYPWVAVYNTEITNIIQKGVYIVYLFVEDMSRVYLTLNQGCTKLKNDLGVKATKNEMIKIREEIRVNVSNIGFNIDNDLHIGNVDYEIGSIFYKEYVIKSTIKNIQRYINYKGFIYSYEQLSNFYLSLKQNHL